MPLHGQMNREIFVPAAIYLSTSSTGGDRLLFHYPYDVRDSISEASTPMSSPIKTKETDSKLQGGAENAGSISISNEQVVARHYRYGQDIRRWRQQSESSATLGGREECTPPPYIPLPTPTGGHGEIDTSGTLPYNLTGSTLASLFMCRGGESDQRIELRIEDTLFVGYPCQLDAFQSEHNLRFSIIFELHPSAPRSAIDIYHQLARHIAFALRNAEARTSYLSNQKDEIQQIFDQIGEQAESEQEHPSPYDLVLEKSSLCREIRAIHESIRSRGQVNIFINGCIPVNFCVPHLSYRMATTGNVFVDPDAVKAAVNNIQPYQGLMLVDPEDVKASLMPDSNPTMLRFIKYATPHRSLRQVALQTDLTYSHIFQLTANLVYWGKAIIIFPLCESNQYELVPDVDLLLNDKVAADFQSKFPSLNLIKVLREFCQPIAVTDMKELHSSQEQSALVGWLLRHRIIVQLHSYLMLVNDDENKVQKSANGVEDSPDAIVTAVRLPSWMGLPEVPLPRLVDENGTRIQDFNNEMARLQISKSDRTLIETLVEFSPSQAALERLLSLPIAGTREELTRFVKLLPYFDGTNHLEHIMYHENMPRSELIALIDRCRSVLVTTHLPDSRTACFFGL